MTLKVIKWFYGARLGGFVDIYEVPVTLEPKAAIDVILPHFKGKVMGRAYDGAYIVVLSKRRELAFYVRPNCVLFEDRHTFLLSVRFWPSRLRGKLKKISRVLTSVA